MPPGLLSLRLRGACRPSPASELRLDLTIGVGWPVSTVCDGSRTAYGGGRRLQLRIGHRPFATSTIRDGMFATSSTIEATVRPKFRCAEVRSCSDACAFCCRTPLSCCIDSRSCRTWASSASLLPRRRARRRRRRRRCRPPSSFASRQCQEDARKQTQRGISHPRNGRVPEGAPPTIRCAAGVPGGRWGSVVYGWRAPRPPRVVFVLGFASVINSLTSGKNGSPALIE